VQTAGGSSTTLPASGYYTFYQGCFASSVSYTVNPAFITYVGKEVGDGLTGVYTNQPVSSNRAWCVLEQTEIVQTNNAAWSGAAKLVP